MSFGECIKRRRLELGLTQWEVGERLGVTEVMIRIYEADQRHPKMSTAKRFAGVPHGYHDSLMEKASLPLLRINSNLMEYIFSMSPKQPCLHRDS